MKFLASYILKGQKEAIVVTAATALLSLIFFPLSYISAAAVALVTLHIGARKGLVVAIIAATIMAALAQLLVGSYLPALIYLLLFWMPLWWIANRLRRDNLLSLGLLQTAALGLVVIAGFYLVLDNPGAWWKVLLDEPFQIIFKDVSDVDSQQPDLMIEQMANLMTGMMAVAFMLHLLGSLFLARWWQALHFKPGGFGREFREIRLGRVAAGAALVLLIIAFSMGSMLLIELLMAMILVFMLQGLAVVHGVVYNRKAHQAWLIGQYVLLMVLMLQMVMALALIGLVDNWFNFRGFFALKDTKKNAEKDPDEGAD